VNQIQNSASAIRSLNEQQLSNLCWPVLEIASQRAERGTDTPYDHFLYEEVGDLRLDEDKVGNLLYPTAQQQYPDGELVTYAKRLTSSYAEHDGTLVHVRQASRPSSFATRDFRVVTDNLHSRDRHAWQILKVDHRLLHAGSGLETRLYLSDGELEEVPAENVEVSAQNVVERLIRERALATRIQRWWDEKPQMILSSDGNRWQWPGEKSQQLCSLESVESQLRFYGHQVMSLLSTKLDPAKVA
jgi:hypothetical protein